ncbi:MAG: hypothetical protein IJJ10_00920 [Bacillus sp. (in: Bacteria)]|nr:hypothetical protein [Bacillus sp. (in: firmicutes)]
MNERQKSRGAKGKVVFIKRMNAKKQRIKEKSGFHQVNESQKVEEQREKWCSSGE